MEETKQSRSAVDVVLLGCIIGGLFVIGVNVNKLEQRVEALERPRPKRPRPIPKPPSESEVELEDNEEAPPSDLED